MPLNLTRKPTQKILIHDPDTDYTITVEVTEIRRNQVRLKVDAPDKVKIYREEVQP